MEKNKKKRTNGYAQKYRLKIRESVKSVLNKKKLLVYLNIRIGLDWIKHLQN